MRARYPASAFVAVLVLGTTIPSASAAAPDDRWFLQSLDIADARAAGWTGSGVTVAVLDGQINPNVPTLVGADLRIREPSFCHSSTGELLPASTSELSEGSPTNLGTNAASMILGSGAGYAGDDGMPGVAPGATVLYYSVYAGTFMDGSPECLDATGWPGSGCAGLALNEAIDAGADIVTLPLDCASSPEFRAAMERANSEGVTVVGSVVNDAPLDSIAYLPQGFAGIVKVQSTGADGRIRTFNDAQLNATWTDVAAPGHGIRVQGNAATSSWEDNTLAKASLAPPLVAGILALAKQKYPEATGNQLVRSLIDTTSGEPDRTQDPRRRVDYGHGLVSLTGLLANDPMDFADTNPLILEEEEKNSFVSPPYDDSDEFGLGSILMAAILLPVVALGLVTAIVLGTLAIARRVRRRRLRRPPRAETRLSDPDIRLPDGGTLGSPE